MMGAPVTFVAACVQMSSGVSVANNLAHISNAVAAAKALGADWVFLPEGSNLMQRDGDAAWRSARYAGRDGGETIGMEAQDGIPSDEISFLARLAKQHQLWLHAGSLILRHESKPQKLVNRSLLFSADGLLVASYDKIHMFDVTLQGGESYCESASYIAGSRAVLAPSPWGALGMSICYDLRFPRLYRHLAEVGAVFFAVPSAFTKTTGMAHWSSLLRARAIENGCFVFAAAQSGLLEDGRSCWGRSMIISPWGEVLAEAGDESATIVSAEIDVSRVAETRKRIPALALERPFLPASPSHALA